MISYKDMKILELQAQIDHAQKRIEALEARNSDLVTQCDTHAQHKMAFRNRIEVLEAALWEVLDAHNKHDADEVARAALAPEQDK